MDELDIQFYEDRIDALEQELIRLRTENPAPVPTKVLVEEVCVGESEKILRQQVGQLKKELKTIQSSFPYRVLNLLWRLSLALGVHHLLDYFKRKNRNKIGPSPVQARKCPAPKQPKMVFDFEHCLNSYEYRFLLYKEERIKKYPFLLSAVQTPHIPGRVSVILPVYNGGDLLAASIDSVLAQTYADFEFIILNDGSTDGTPGLIDSYAQKDSRISVVHQENQKLPRTLSNGFKLARGEFLTWTSADNLMAPDCLESLVAELAGHPETGMVFANIELIDENGAPITDNRWYPDPAHPQTVVLPECMLELNTYANNYIGAAFLYRTAVAQALEEYSYVRFTTEDYDYWMRINDIFNLRHASFKQPVYQYRLHPESLTAKDKELGISENRYRLMRWDDFRRSFLLRPLYWKIDGIGLDDKRFSAFFADMQHAGHSTISDFDEQAALCQSDYTSTVYMAYSGKGADPFRLPAGCYKVYVAPRPEPDPPLGWDCYISVAPVSAENFIGEHKGWFSFDSGRAMFAFLEIRAKSRFLSRMEGTVELPREYSKKYTCVVAHNRGGAQINRTIEALTKMNYDADEYEIIVVAPESERETVSHMFEKIWERQALLPDMLRIVFSPTNDVAECHNIAAWAAKGERIAFFAAGAVCDNNYLKVADLAWLFHPEVAAICGRACDSALPCGGEERFAVMLDMEGYASRGCVCCETSELQVFGGFHVHESGGSVSFRDSGWELSLLHSLVAHGRLLLDTNALRQLLPEGEIVTRESVFAHAMNRYYLENLGLTKFDSYPDVIRARIQDIRKKAFEEGVDALSNEEWYTKRACEQLWETACRDFGVRCQPDAARTKYTVNWTNMTGEYSGINKLQFLEENGVLGQATPAVSVIVPIYKVEKFLRRCVKSIQEQTVKDIEIILVDDGSPDNCPAMCDAFAQADSRIVVIHKPNGGLSDARNAGIDVAKGEYFAFVDSDDWIEPDMLEELLFAAIYCDAGISACGFINVYSEHEENSAEETGQIFLNDNFYALRSMLEWGRFKCMAWDKLYHRRLFAEGKRYPKGKLHEDEFFTHRVVYEADRCAYVDRGLYHYDQTREDSITGTVITERNLDVVEAYREKVDFYRERTNTALYEKCLNMYCWTALDRLEKCKAAGLEGEQVERVKGWLREDYERFSQGKVPDKRLNMVAEMIK